jgi:hypothetical protein
MLRHPLALALGLLLAVPGFAADKKDDKKADKWDVNAAHGPTKTIKFTTDEGTWMDLDVSRDGKQIAFSLLGDIYVLPIEGG